MAYSAAALLISSCSRPEGRSSSVHSVLNDSSQAVSIAHNPPADDTLSTEYVTATETPLSITSELLDGIITTSTWNESSEIVAPSSPDIWKDMPAVPEIDPEIIRNYAIGIARGNNPNVFSKIGDCSTSNSWFLGPFDDGEQYYDLGEYA